MVIELRYLRSSIAKEAAREAAIDHQGWFDLVE